MRIVFYDVNTIVLKVGCEPHPEARLFFGTLEDVNKELKDLEKIIAQGKIVHANDPETLVQLMNREQVVKLLLGHDLDKLPKYPQVGMGESRLRFKECETIAFINQVKVSIRGEKSDKENVQAPVNILLPPGVRL